MGRPGNKEQHPDSPFKSIIKLNINPRLILHKPTIALIPGYRAHKPYNNLFNNYIHIIINNTYPLFSLIIY